jgi:tetratricopeptide (TPR) repeat protein
MISICIIGNNPEKTLKTIQENDLSDVKEIIVMSKVNEDLEVPIKSIAIKTENKAVIRNKMIEKSEGDYILWLSENNEIEDSTIEELKEITEEFPDADIIYPNEILKIEDEEEVRNFSDLYKQESVILQSLAIENHIPQWGVLTKKEIFNKYGNFNESYEDYEFYDFVYKNIKSLTLKHADLSYVTTWQEDTFVDTSYRSKTLRDILNIYNWQKEIFPSLNWKQNQNLAYATAYTMIGDQLSKYLDLFNAAEFYRKALLSFHNQVSLKKLINTLINMGLFEKARALTSIQQGLSVKDVEEITDKIKSIESLTEELEKAVEEGKAGDILVASNDIMDTYQGAPIYNIFGVIFALKKEFDTAYKFLYKAVTMNPVEENYLYNLLDVAEKLNRKENIKGLLQRLIGEKF